MARIIDGKGIAEDIHRELKEEVAILAKRAGLPDWLLCW